jgi:hypothetical protein
VAVEGRQPFDGLDGRRMSLTGTPLAFTVDTTPPDTRWGALPMRRRDRAP